MASVVQVQFIKSRGQLISFSKDKVLRYWFSSSGPKVLRYWFSSSGPTRAYGQRCTSPVYQVPGSAHQFL